MQPEPLPPHRTHAGLVPRSQHFTQHWISLLAATFVISACVGDRPDSCERQSDCTSGFCSSAGFCELECSTDRDCPCASFCSMDCRICLRNDLTGPATCFAYNRGLSNAEILGACRSGLPDASPAEAGVLTCTLNSVTPAGCTLTANVDATASSQAGSVLEDGAEQ
jgi:hypothetical protein